MRHLWLVLIVCAISTPLSARRQELGLTLGRVLSKEQSGSGGRFELKHGTALQANYAIRLIDSAAAALLGEVHVLASQGRNVTSTITSATRDFATLYITPGIRMKLTPNRRVSPHFAIGGGYALYEQSTMTVGGSPNSAPRHIHRGVFNFGAGVDIGVLRWLGLRFEVRDFYSGRPSLNIAVRGGLHNVVLGGGFVLEF